MHTWCEVRNFASQNFRLTSEWKKLRCKNKKQKKAKEKYFIIANKYALPPNI